MRATRNRPGNRPTSKGPSGNKCAVLGVEAPVWQGVRSAHTGSMQATNNAARRDASAARTVQLFLDGPLVVRFIITVTHRGRRGARPARREEGEYREYLTDEQRRGAGCIGGRMPA